MSAKNYLRMTGPWSILLGCSLYFWLIPGFVDLPPAAKFTPGPTPQTFPYVLAWLLIGFGALSLAIDLFRPTVQTEADPEDGFRFDVRVLLLLCLCIAGYLVLFESIGFFIATLAVLFVFFAFLSPLKLWQAALMALVLTLGIVFVFSDVLQIPLPMSVRIPGL